MVIAWIFVVIAIILVGGVLSSNDIGFDNYDDDDDDDD